MVAMVAKVEARAVPAVWAVETVGAVEWAAAKAGGVKVVG